MPPTKRKPDMTKPASIRYNEHAVMRKKSVAYRQGLYQPYPKGTFGHELFRIINEQGLPDVILGRMTGFGDTVINKLRLKTRDPSTMKMATLNKLLNRCGYKLWPVPMTEEEESAYAEAQQRDGCLQEY